MSLPRASSTEVTLQQAWVPKAPCLSKSNPARVYSISIIKIRIMRIDLILIIVIIIIIIIGLIGVRRGRHYDVARLKRPCVEL